MHLDQVAESDDDLTSEADAVVVQHVTQCAKDQRDEVDELDRLVGLETAQQRAHGTTRLHLDERVVVLLETMLVDDEKIREVVLVRNSQVGSEIVNDRRSAETCRWVQRLTESKHAGKQLGPLGIRMQLRHLTSPVSRRLRPNSPMDWQIFSRMFNSFSFYTTHVTSSGPTSNNCNNCTLNDDWYAGDKFLHTPSSDVFSFCLIRMQARFRTDDREEVRMT